MIFLGKWFFKYILRIVFWPWWELLKYINWWLLVWNDASVKVKGEINFIDAVALDSCTDTNGHEERYATGVTKSGGFVGP